MMQKTGTCTRLSPAEFLGGTCRLLEHFSCASLNCRPALQMQNFHHAVPMVEICDLQPSPLLTATREIYYYYYYYYITFITRTM